jgi:hypothetical protein
MVADETCPGQEGDKDQIRRDRPEKWISDMERKVGEAWR